MTISPQKAVLAALMSQQMAQLQGCALRRIYKVNNIRGLDPVAVNLDIRQLVTDGRIIAFAFCRSSEKTGIHTLIVLQEIPTEYAMSEKPGQLLVSSSKMPGLYDFLCAQLPNSRFWRNVITKQEGVFITDLRLCLSSHLPGRYAKLLSAIEKRRLLWNNRKLS